MEYYGEKPKKFTKKWWSYFWDYYKIHTIVVAFIIIAVVATIIDVNNKERYDGSLVLAGNIAVSEEQSQLIKDTVCKQIDDLDENGKKSILIEQLTFSENDTDAQYSMAMRTKFDLKMQTNETFAFVMDKKQLESVVNSSEMQQCFATTDEWLLETDFTDDDFYIKDGKKMALNLKNSELFGDMGFGTEEYYAILRYNYDQKNDKLNKEFENAKKILNAIVK